MTHSQLAHALPLDQLYRRYGYVVLRRARQILDDEEEAEDVLHDIFASLAQRSGQFRGDSLFSTWLYAVTTNACLTRLRRQKRRSRLLSRHRVGRDIVVAASGEKRVLLGQLLRHLPDELVKVAIYHHLDQMTHAEIATILGCSRRRVGDLLARITRQTAKLAELEAVQC